MKPNSPNYSDLVVFLYHDEERFLAHSPQLNILGFGNTEDAAKADFDKAIKTFISFHTYYGNLKEVLKQLGFTQNDNQTESPQCVQVPNSVLSHNYNGKFSINKYNLQTAQ